MDPPDRSGGSQRPQPVENSRFAKRRTKTPKQPPRKQTDDQIPAPLAERTKRPMRPSSSRMKSLDTALISISGAFLVLAAATTTLRCYARLKWLGILRADDYLMLLSLALYATTDAFDIHSVVLTEGTMEEVMENRSSALLATYLGEVFFIVTTLTIKLSIGIFLLRLVQTKLQAWTIYVTLAAVTGYSIAYFVLRVLQCIPPSQYWHPALHIGSSWSGSFNASISYTHSAPVGTADLIFAAVPILPIWSLYMNRAMKISIAAVLGLLALAGITSFVRMVFIPDFKHITPLSYFGTSAAPANRGRASSASR